MTPTNPADTVLLEIRERLVRIETQLDHYNETRETASKALALAERNASDIAELKTYATENRISADNGKHIAETCRDDISEIKDSRKWSFRAMVTLGIPLVLGTIANFVLNFMAA